MSAVQPETGCRLPPLQRESLDERGRNAFDRQLDPAHGSIVGLRGPTGIRLHSPAIAENAQEMVRFFRTETLLDEQTREIAIITTARAHDSQFEWAAHAPLAAKVGVGAATIDAVRHNKPLAELPERDALIIAVGRELFGERKLSSDLYERALAHFSERGLVELITLMAMYAGTASLLAAFDMQLPDGVAPDLP
ncbi:MAG: carboxymuconolactone decarboxylase family protein [Hyphomicrobiaceae bacterium]